MVHSQHSKLTPEPYDSQSPVTNMWEGLNEEGCVGERREKKEKKGSKKEEDRKRWRKVRKVVA